MAFNYAYEKKKFEKEWKQLRKEYAAAGMSFEDIEAMRQFDLKVFNSNRSISAIHSHCCPATAAKMIRDRKISLSYWNGFPKRCQ